MTGKYISMHRKTVFISYCKLKLDEKKWMFLLGEIETPKFGRNNSWFLLLTHQDAYLLMCSHIFQTIQVLLLTLFTSLAIFTRKLTYIFRKVVLKKRLKFVIKHSIMTSFTSFESKWCKVDFSVLKHPSLAPSAGVNTPVSRTLVTNTNHVRYICTLNRLLWNLNTLFYFS